MKKRMLAVLLVAAVMAMGTLSGCENKPEEGNVASSGKEGQTNQDSGSGEKDYTMYQVTDPIEIEFW